MSCSTWQTAAPSPLSLEQRNAILQEKVVSLEARVVQLLKQLEELERAADPRLTTLPVLAPAKTEDRP